MAGCPTFAALSYMWGSEKDRKTVSINGYETTITANAFLLLNALRHHQQRRTKIGGLGLPRMFSGFINVTMVDHDAPHLEWIWMDGICINQSDITERNHQVRLMQKIYSLSSHVFFHIGPHSTAKAEQYLEACRAYETRDSVTPVSVLERLAGVADVINSSAYSRRLWVVQELVLGCRVSFVTDKWMIRLFPELTSHGALPEIQNARERWHSSLQELRGLPLSELLRDYRAYGCKNPLDRVYGLLGICSDQIPIDYNLCPEALAGQIIDYFKLKLKDHADECNNADGDGGDGGDDMDDDEFDWDDDHCYVDKNEFQVWSQIRLAIGSLETAFGCNLKKIYACAFEARSAQRKRHLDNRKILNNRKPSKLNDKNQRLKKRKKVWRKTSELSRMRPITLGRMVKLNPDFQRRRLDRFRSRGYIDIQELRLLASEEMSNSESELEEHQYWLEEDI